MLIQIISKNNVDNLLTIDEYKRNSLIVFYSVEEERQLRNYVNKVNEKYENLMDITTKEYKSLDDLVMQIKKLRPKYFQFNDLKIMESLAIVNGINRDETDIVFYNSNSSNLVKFKKDQIEISKKRYNKMEVNDYIQLAGGDIELRNDRIFDRLIEDGTFALILKDIKHWRKFSRAFVDSEIVRENETRNLVFTVKFKNVDRQLIKYFKEYINHFVEKKYFIIIAENMDRIIYRFANISLKSFFKLSGSWLELITYSAVKDLKLDDIDASVLFTWDNKIKNYENEIDLLATKNGKLIVISCKDTKKVNKDFLNEIIVNSTELGDDNVIKALVTTSQAIHDSFFIRAKELNISIIQFSGNYERFKSDLMKILK